MTDQVYHQVQYPMKKAINLLKKVNLDGEDAPVANLTDEEREELQEFLTNWDDSKSKVADFVSELRQLSRNMI